MYSLDGEDRQALIDTLKILSDCYETSVNDDDSMSKSVFLIGIQDIMKSLGIKTTIEES